MSNYSPEQTISIRCSLTWKKNSNILPKKVIWHLLLAMEPKSKIPSEIKSPLFKGGKKLKIFMCAVFFSFLVHISHLTCLVSYYSFWSLNRVCWHFFELVEVELVVEFMVGKLVRELRKKQSWNKNLVKSNGAQSKRD